MSSEPESAGAADDARALTRVRWIVGAPVAGVLLLTGLAGVLGRATGLSSLVLPAAVAGAASPVVGYRLYRLAEDSASRLATREARRQAFERALVLATCVTELAALFGALVYAFSGDPLALIGVLMHVLLAGALWPSEEKLAAFLDAPAPAPQKE